MQIYLNNLKSASFIDYFYCLDQRKAVNIYHCGRKSHQRGVKTVEHTTMTGKDIPAVFDTDGALEQTLDQITPSAEDTYDDT